MDPDLFLFGNFFTRLLSPSSDDVNDDDSPSAEIGNTSDVFRALAEAAEAFAASHKVGYTRDEPCAAGTGGDAEFSLIRNLFNLI